jgi:hypothetical protein
MTPHNKDLKIQKSSIIKNLQSFTKLTNFFDKKIKKMELVFKASENEFKIVECQKKYGKLKNTIIICETTKGKVIGCYSHVSFLN